MLKKCTVIITIFLLGIAIGIGIGVYFNICNQKKTVKEISVANQQDESDSPKISEVDSIGRIDYPLIDIYFQSSSSYRIEITDFDNTEDQKEVRGKGDDFQFIKGDFSVVTIPTGMGTTAEFYLSVYKDDKCIKEMPCISIESDVFKDKWIKK